MTIRRLRSRTPIQFLQDVGDRLCARDELDTDDGIHGAIHTLCRVWCEERERAEFFGGRGWIEADGTVVRLQS